MLDEHPMFINIEEAFTVLTGYPEAELDRKVLTCIASCANSQGVAWPTQQWVAATINEIKMSVCRSTKRLKDKNLFTIGKEKKGKDRNPRNVYTFNPGLLRKNPDTRSSHFDAGKWGRVAARLKKYVSKAVDNLKQVAVGAAKTMSAGKRKPRKQWQNGSYQHPYYSYQNMKAAYPTAEESAKPTPKPSAVDRRIQDMLSEKGFSVTDPAFPKIGLWMLDRLTEKSKPEDYDAMFQQAVEKFSITLPRVSQPVDSRSHSDAVRDVRMMSSEDEPKTMGGILGAAFA